MAILRPHHIAISLGMGEHEHDDIFGDGDGIDADPVGDDHTAFFQNVERHEVEPGIDRVQPFEVGRRPGNFDHGFFLIEIEPADLCLRREIQRLFLAGEPQRLDPVGKARFDQWTDHGGQGGFGHRFLLDACHCRSETISQTVPCDG